MAIPNPAITHAELLQLKRWNTPTIYNGWEQITQQDPARDGFNIEETHDFMPQMGPMVGYALTLVIQPGNASTPADLWDDYYEFVAAASGPKIIVVCDLDQPATYGSFWGEVNSNIHRSLGCVGTITDGAIRDVDEMTNAGFKALARRRCVGHAHSRPVSWGDEVNVFGTPVRSGDLIHADPHGFLVIPPADQADILRAATFMDENECRTVIDAARTAAGQTNAAILKSFQSARQEFGKRAQAEFGNRGEW